MKTYRFIHSAPSHYVLHDLADGKNFHVAKRGLDEETKKRIESLPPVKMADGGQVPPPPPVDPDKAKQVSDSFKSAFDNGGQVPPPPIDPDKAKQVSDSFKHVFDEGGKVPGPQPSINADDVRTVQGLGFIDRVGMVRQGLDPSNPDHIRQYRQQKGNYADGGQVPQAPPIDPDKARQVSDSFKHVFDQGGQVPPPIDPDKAKQVSDSFKHVFADGGEVSTVKDAADSATDRAFNMLSQPVPPPNPNLPPDFENQVKQEQVRLGVNAGIPGLNADGTSTTSPDLTPFRQDAENNVLANFNLDKQQAAAKSQADLAQQTAKIAEMNKLRVQAGLPPMDMPAGAEPSATQSSTVAPADQVSFKTPASSNSGTPQAPDLLGSFNRAENLEKAGIMEGAKAQAQGFQDTSKLWQQHLNDEAQRYQQFQAENDALSKQSDTLFQAARDAKINPNQFWESKSTGGKITAALGLIFGGIGSALTHQPSAALEVMQKAIQNDIDAQKDAKNDKMNLYKLGLEKYRDHQAAYQFATLQSNAMLQGQLAKVAASTGNAQAIATAHQMIGELGMKNTLIKQELAQRQVLLNMMNQPNSAPVSGVDSQQLRNKIASGFIPKDMQASAMKEYGDYSKLSKVLDHTDDVFKGAQPDANYTERFLPHWTPTVRDSSKNYEQLTEKWLGQITKDTEGRVTPQDVELMRPSLPRAGDSPELRQKKLDDIKDMIREKYSFPTLTTYRLLNERDPVATSKATRTKSFNEKPPVLK